ncbi:MULTISPECIES: polysaccharide deacetylase family protein [Streptomyces]|uniref:polysaccharide deacetylase family protein n=2 Tax=Streptomyces TaxID=1883 RepID=UPI0004C88C85|nr:MULTISPECIES: polysaccharide deacetylase family protein [Streptomyces]KOU29940.1 polysaccharide deacetylase [Streptomyces sp. WM6373]KOU63777.1 polysaccharide deacetylase [Streptomyces sp. IGB124]KOU78216.1 polysaccharide deacetylase [Streptomyces sp. XY66]KOU85618.1 polysaccharide deacetylase [Streptomyces sp. XY58]KOV05111.1 polysaccharide deacetylase [Streptomyces sp. XY37]
MVAGTLAAGALALSLTGCGESVDPIERLGRKATQEPSQTPSASASATAPAPDSAGAQGGASDEAYKKWGLTAPVQYAPKPAQKPQIPKAAPGKVPVIDRIPLPAEEKIVFLTFDDGAEKDPEFLKMAADLKLPISMFLTDSVASSDYGHFEKLRDNGSASTVNNHTLTHPNLRTLSFEAQKKEICGQQDKLEKRFGQRPPLFRPPFGNYNDDTLRAASECGVSSVLLWRVSMQINNFQYAQGSALQPGDIILAHFRGPSELKGATEIQMTTRMLQRIQEQGYRIGRLEDYL